MGTRHALLSQVLVFFGACALFATGPANAATFDCGSRPIRLAFYEHGLFYVDSDANGNKARGFDKDIVDELAKRSGCRFETQVMLRARIWADLASGGLDMSVSGIQNADRDVFAWFAHYAVIKSFAIIPVETAKTVRRAKDFIDTPGLKFGVVRAAKYGVEQDQWLDTLRAQQRVEESQDVDTLFRKLKDKRIQAMYGQPVVYRRLLELHDMQKDVVVQDWTPSEKGVLHGLIMAKSRFSEASAKQWHSLIKDMHRDGTLKAIFSKYLPPDEAIKTVDF